MGRGVKKRSGDHGRTEAKAARDGHPKRVRGLAGQDLLDRGEGDLRIVVLLAKMGQEYLLFATGSGLSQDIAGRDIR